MDIEPYTDANNGYKMAPFIFCSSVSQLDCCCNMCLNLQHQRQYHTVARSVMSVAEVPGVDPKVSLTSQFAKPSCPYYGHRDFITNPLSPPQRTLPYSLIHTPNPSHLPDIVVEPTSVVGQNNLWLLYFVTVNGTLSCY